MAKKKTPLLSAIEESLDCGRFIPYRTNWTFIEGLQRIKSQIDNLVKQGDAAQAVSLYELFIAGCYEKMEELDDSGGNMGMFFEELFYSWVAARQSANLEPEETVNQILKMMDNDEYGLCYKIENKLAAILDKEEIFHFEEKVYTRFEEAFLKKRESQKTIYDFSSEVRNNADILKAIYMAGKKTDEYLGLCEKIGITPKDCEAIANIYKTKKQWEKALYFVNKGLSLEKGKNWPNQSSFALSDLKRELLNRLGRKEEALQTAWGEFVESPSGYSYEELMKYVPKKDKELWYRRAIQATQKEPLDSGIIDFFVVTEELEILSERILCASDNELEELGYYAVKNAAERLSKNHWAAAAKIYRVLGMEILNNGRSKYYKYALNNFKRAKKLYEKANLEKDWLSIVDIVCKNHFRKHAFMKDFGDIVAGRRSEREPSFSEIAGNRWKKQIS